MSLRVICGYYFNENLKSELLKKVQSHGRKVELDFKFTKVRRYFQEGLQSQLCVLQQQWAG